MTKNQLKIAYLLLAAGYKIAHRPVFAMKGSTRLCRTINPYTKYGIDAGKIEYEGLISLERVMLFKSQVFEEMYYRDFSS